MTLGGKIATADDLVLALYRASSELPVEEFQQAALELIKPLLAFDSGWWGSGCLVGDVAGYDLSVNAVQLHDVSPEFLAGYEEVKDQDIAPPTVLAQGGGIYRFHVPTVYSDKKTSLAARHFLKNHNIGNMLFSADFKPDNGLTNFVTLFRANADKDYSNRDQQLMQALFPHLMEALSINRLIHLKHLDGSQRRFQLAIADKRGMLYHAESGFMGLLREEFRSSVTDRLPTDLITSLGGSGRYAGRTLVIQCRQSAGLLFLKARARLPVDALSKRETDIAHLMAQGFDYRKISQVLNISPETVRSHFKNIYKKLHISNKAQLIVMLGGV